MPPPKTRINTAAARTIRTTAPRQRPTRAKSLRNDSLRLLFTARLGTLFFGKPRLLADAPPQRRALLPTPAASFPRGRWTLTHCPSSPARLTAYLQQQDEASLTAFSTASLVSPVRF